MRTLKLICLLLAVAFHAPALLAQTPPLVELEGNRRMPVHRSNPDAENVDLITLRLKKHDIMNPKRMSEAQFERVLKAAGVPLRFERVDAGDVQVLRLPRKMREADAEAIARRIAKLPEIEYAGADGPFGFHAARSGPEEPNDPEYRTRQWSYWNLRSSVAGANVEPAWDVTTGAETVVVAVLDSGVRPNHPDLAARLLPGYDFVSDPVRANDGDGRDADAADPGDWVSAAEVAAGGRHARCKVQDSTWHGTTVAGIIGALTNNGLGVAAIDWKARILPVRVAGKCVDDGQGTRSDLEAAIRWAAGVTQPGIPNNPHPARVINLSLGANGVGACPVQLQAAITDVVKRGIVVVAAAGNENRPAADVWPANCKGVIGVGATRRTGARDPQSNSGGPAVALSAPGAAESDVVADTIRGLGNAGATIPGADAFGSYSGTSFAAPHVSGVVALMLALRPDLKPNEVREILVKSARPFVTGTDLDCTTALCGAGMVDASAALTATRLGLKPRVIRESSGSRSALFLHEDGSLWGIGSFPKGGLGDGGSDTVHDLPTRAAVSDLIEVAYRKPGGNASGERYFGLKRDGTVWTWGAERSAGLLPRREVPTQVVGLPPVAALSAGSGITLALARDGSVWAWGPNRCFVDGSVLPPNADGCVVDRAVLESPFLVAGLPPIRAILAGMFAGFAVDTTGRVWNWGINWGLELGVGVGTYEHHQRTPVVLQDPDGVVAVATCCAGQYPGGIAAVSASGEVWVWGGDMGAIAPAHIAGSALRAGEDRALVGLAGDRCIVDALGNIVCDGTRRTVLSVSPGLPAYEVRADGGVYAQENGGLAAALPGDAEPGVFSLARTDGTTGAPVARAVRLRTDLAASDDAAGNTLLHATILNTGAVTATGVRVAVSLSRPVDSVALPHACVGDVEIECLLGALAPGVTATLTFTLTSPDPGTMVASAATLAQEPGGSGWMPQTSDAVAFGAPAPTTPAVTVPLPGWAMLATGAVLGLTGLRRIAPRAARSP
jgi:serine protease